MLLEFLNKNRETLIDRCRLKVTMRRTPQVTDEELWYGIPLFLTQLTDTLRLESPSNSLEADAGPVASLAIPTTSSSTDIGRTGAQHGKELLRRGVTVDQVVHDYGDLCQAITELAIEQSATISVAEFHTLNRCLDNAIAGAVAEFGRQHEAFASDATNERLGFLAHELRNFVGTAILAVATIKKGSVGLTGATGALLDRSLLGLRDLIDRTLVEVRLSAGLSAPRERITVRNFIGDVQVAAAMEAAARDLEFTVAPIDEDLVVEGDRQILSAALVNVLQNAVKFTRARGHVSLNAYAADGRVLIAIADECGGLPKGKAEEIFRPFVQLAAERTGLGLGLSISRRGVEANDGKLSVRDVPGTGCVFTIDLPRATR